MSAAQGRIAAGAHACTSSSSPCIQHVSHTRHPVYPHCTVRALRPLDPPCMHAVLTQVSVPTSSGNMRKTGTRMPPPMLATWTLRCGCPACSFTPRACFPLDSFRHNTVATHVLVFQVFEEMIWELFTQAGPVGEWMQGCLLLCAVVERAHTQSNTMGLLLRSVTPIMIT